MNTAENLALIFSHGQYNAMRRHVAANFSEERCGLVAGKQHIAELVLPIENQCHSPHVFQMNPQEQVIAFDQIEKANLELLAIYHSHPTGPTHPSQIDLDEFRYPGIATIIWFLQENKHWQMKVFSIAENQFTEIPWHIL